MTSPLRQFLARTGLLGPAFRAREWLRALTGPAVPAIGPDGLPLPRRIHMIRVVSHCDWRQFYESGQQQAAVFAELAEAAGAPLSQAATVLDWGCGCGRITRHLSGHTGARILGRDPDPRTVGWAARHLPGDYRRSGYQPPLDLGDGAVDAIVSLSVFTHLTREGQRAWLAELARVLRPGGLLLLTFMDGGHHRVGHLGEAGLAALDTEGFALTTPALEGTNHMATFQTAEQLSASAAPWFDVALARASTETPLHQAVLGLIRRA